MLFAVFVWESSVNLATKIYDRFERVQKQRVHVFPDADGDGN